MAGNKQTVPKPILAISLVAIMLLSGCLGVFDGDDSNHDFVEIDLGDAMKRSIGSPYLESFSDCEELESALKISIEEEAKTSILQAVEDVYYWGGGMWLEDDAEMAMDTGSSSTPAPSTRQEGVDYSGTNNQEQGVDEADFVKTDGYHIYFVDNGVLHIMDIPEFGEIEHASTTSIQGSPVAMMLNEESLVVISTVSSWNIDSQDPLSKAMGWGEDWYGWRTSTLTKFTVYDVSNSSSPEVSRELYIEGYYMTAREVAGTVRTVTHTWMDIPGLQTWITYPEEYWDSGVDDDVRLNMREIAAQEAIDNNQEIIEQLSLEDMLPQVHERVGSQIITHHMDGDDCSDFAAPEESLNRGYTSIFTLDLISEELEFEADHIVGNWPLVYSSQDTLIITENAWDWWWFWGNDNLDEATNIHTFDISQPGETAYAGSGRVDGTILDQFSISEHEGVVRVATTTGQWGRWWMANPEPMENHVITLSHATDPQSENVRLLEIGRVDGIAYNETIWSARFVEDRAYIVTFENMDPLWTIDLSDPTNPTIMGELEVPGVSTYIHPLSDDAILTIGLGPADEETGLGLDWSHTRLSLFNVSNFSDPQLSQTLSLSPVADPNNGWSWAWSEATWEHKAFQYWAPKGMLAVPLNTYRYDYYYDDAGKYHYDYDWVSKLMIVNVTEDGLELYGEVNHSQFYETDENRWWNSYNIRRSIFMGDYIYAISHGGITVTNLDTLEESDSHQFVEYNQEQVFETSESSEQEDNAEG
ncbi:MAG: beta-propeller domain-containing protein [Candidatus Poseidoniales archaeon]|nr:beta-propeller domain-containing protein [Candidatus Poseidoniales archaeon]